MSFMTNNQYTLTLTIESRYCGFIPQLYQFLNGLAGVMDLTHSTSGNTTIISSRCHFPVPLHQVYSELVGVIPEHVLAASELQLSGQVAANSHCQVKGLLSFAEFNAGLSRLGGYHPSQFQPNMQFGGYGSPTQYARPGNQISPQWAPQFIKPKHDNVVNPDKLSEATATLKRVELLSAIHGYITVNDEAPLNNRALGLIYMPHGTLMALILTKGSVQWINGVYIHVIGRTIIAGYGGTSITIDKDGPVVNSHEKSDKALGIITIYTALSTLLDEIV